MFGYGISGDKQENDKYYDNVFLFAQFRILEHTQLLSLGSDVRFNGETESGLEQKKKKKKTGYNLCFSRTRNNTNNST